MEGQKMTINWTLGFRRLGQFLLGLCWLIFIAANWNQPAARLGEYVIYMLIFTGCAVLFFRLVAWVVRGFIERPPGQVKS